jgi:hypothetical protein
LLLINNIQSFDLNKGEGLRYNKIKKKGKWQQYLSGFSLLTMLLFQSSVWAIQNNTSIRGFAETQFTATEDANSFGAGSVNPIFLWQSPHTLFETEFHLEFMDKGVNFDIGYANINWDIHKYITLRAGKFLTPFGIFGEKIHPAWINQFVDVPPGFGHDSWIPSSEVGLEARGAVRISEQLLTYSFYVSNGPELDTINGGLLYTNNDNNTNKAVGTRLSWAHSDRSLEIGLSGVFSLPGDHDSRFEEVSASLFALDINYTNHIAGIGMISLLHQFNVSTLSDIGYLVHEDLETFDNTDWNYFASIAIKPAIEALSNLQFTTRFSQWKSKVDSPFESTGEELVGGINYWIDWKTVIKANIVFGGAGSDSHEEESDHDDEETDFGLKFDHPTYKLQFAIGL